MKLLDYNSTNVELLLLFFDKRDRDREGPCGWDVAFGPIMTQRVNKV